MFNYYKLLPKQVLVTFLLSSKLLANRVQSSSDLPGYSGKGFDPSKSDGTVNQMIHISDPKIINLFHNISWTGIASAFKIKPLPRLLLKLVYCYEGKLRLIHFRCMRSRSEKFRISLHNFDPRLASH